MDDNYTSKQFADTLVELDLRHSIGRTGICYDNATAEFFFAALKNDSATCSLPHPQARPTGHCTIHRSPIQYSISPFGA